MGCFYVGYDYKNRKNGYLKIGESGYASPAKRLSQIRESDAFECLGYIELFDESKAERLLIEAYVRVQLEKMPCLSHVQNDHFTYTIEQGRKHGQAMEFANLALSHAIQCCKAMGIKYQIGTKTFKRG